MTARSVKLPGQVTTRILTVHGPAAAAWLAELPARVAALAAEWALREVGPPFAGARASFVAPAVRADGVPLVLKLAPSPEWLAHEVLALAHWAGRGAVRLEAADLARGALLVERAVPGGPLAAVCAHDDRSATAAAADVIAQFRAAPGVPAAGALPGLATWTAGLEVTPTAGSAPTLGCAIAAELAAACRRAHAVAADLLAEPRPAVVLHGDLHHHNLLTAERASWLAADPKGLVGPREAEAAALLRNPRGFVLGHPDRAALLADRIAVLTERLGDDAGRLAGWGYVLAVVAARWAADDGEGDAEVGRWLVCAVALRAVARARGAA